MRVPSTRRTALLFTAALAACDTQATSTGYAAGGASAAVRVANATTASFDVASSGLVAPGNGGIVFGAASTCTATDAGAPDLTVRVSGTGTALAGFSPAFAAANRYIVIAYANGSGPTQFTTLATSAFTPVSGQAGLKVVDAAPGTGIFDVYVTPAGAALDSVRATNLSFGGNTNFFNVVAGTVQLRLTTGGTQTVVFTAGNESLSAGRNYVLVIGPPTTGTSALRSFLVAGCT